MSETSQLQETARAPVRPLWNLISVALPLVALVVGVAWIASAKFGTGDYAGRLGSAVLLVFAMGIAGAFGFIAAVVSLVRGERWAVLSWIGLVGNAAVALPILNLLLQD